MTGTKKAVAMFGGAAAVAFAVGFGGGVSVSSLDHAPAATTPAVASVAPAVAQAPAFHAATLSACVSGLDC
jgi:hypothetical protein